VRNNEDAFKDESGRLLLSKTAVSQLGEWLWEDYQAFTKRDLSEYEIIYLFVDGIAERLHPGAKREPVLAARGFFRPEVLKLEEIARELRGALRNHHRVRPWSRSGPSGSAKPRNLVEPLLPPTIQRIAGS
jgi:hypothetical protein